MLGSAYANFNNRSPWRLLALMVVLPLMARAGTLTSFSEVRALSHEKAAEGQPVSVEGMVLGSDPASPWNVFLHDGTAGCYVNLLPEGELPSLSPGTRVSVQGVSLQLGYYPSIGRGRLRVLGQGVPPPPIRLAANQLFSPEFDSAWVEVPAVVVGYESRDKRFTLDIEVYGLPFKAELPVEERGEERAAALMQRPVLLRGVLGTIFNQQRQMTDRHFFVSSFAAVVPLMPPTGEAEAPLIEVAQLLTGGFGPQTQVRIQGVITQAAPKGFYLRDTSGSTLVFAARSSRFPPGMRVQVDGFGGVAPFRPVLRAVRVAELERTSIPEPLHFEYTQPNLPMMHAELVTLDARFLARQEGRSDTILQCQVGQQIFEALLPLKESSSLKLEAGDQVRLTGICELTTTHALPRIGWVDGFRLHLSGAGGVAVIARAPWWTSQRLLVALGLMTLVAALALAGTWILRRQVNRQMAVIGDKLRTEAVGKERDRMARDLHDTLEQQLSGVALQLDGLDDVVKANPSAASKELALARLMLRHTRLEARRSVWDLRSKVLEEHGLVAALRDMAESSAGSSGPKVQMRVSGQERRFPAMVEFHLFRIAQEAVANAIKHAGAQNIVLSLEYEADVSRLTVCDDGQGFDPEARRFSPGPHFGLLGMRERAAKAGLSLSLTSAPGSGCLITVLVPRHSATNSS